ncbi:esterase/lipase family protein [Blastococcus capsensis]|uniref:esterase/lipase family protein n=1 Tax=Blastococcus capsensis TaxID=1564163 RepID=UPI0025401516|nr:alpha/beta fold hydrolase [Blastococcus capsensis]MDK3255802.1 alpha/beta fold hydrolase [Blastococcus capsensis]
MSSPEIRVSGGAGGLEADLADLAVLGRSSLDLAEMLAGTGGTCSGVLTDPDLLASAVLDPVGVVRFEAALLESLHGPRGLTALAVHFTARAAALQAAAAAYEAADAALAELADDLHWAAGYFPAATLAGLVTLGVGQFLVDPAGTVAETDALIDDPERWLTEHPGLVDHAVGMAPGLASRVNAMTGGLFSPWLGGSDVRAAARRLGRLWPDGRPVVTPLPDDQRGPVTKPPRNVSDLLVALDLRAVRSSAEEDQISVRVLFRADGSRAYIVDIPGTRSWSPPGASVNPSAHDLGTNVRVLGGDSTTRQAAVAEALRRAGAGSSDPVMLVGHSQGGMVAAQAAHDAGTVDFPYDVRNVLTVGSPIGRADVPSSVQVLALENAHDVVPYLEGRANDDDRNVTTVTFGTQYGSVDENHGIGSAYLGAARIIDRSDDPSIAAYRASAAPFFAGPGEGAEVVAHVYSIGRR